MTHNFEIVDPSAQSIVESLRAIGYQLETAIADIIDNSLAAKAKTVKIDFQWDGARAYVRIEDDGVGMSEAELVQAMRLGSKSPLDDREKNDLGRFGMGLKTASFSQCRRLTVSTKSKQSEEKTRCWDLDFIQKEKMWSLIKGSFDSQSERRLGSIDSKTGTVVLWETLDRVVDEKSGDKAYSMFTRKIERVEKHLAMTFHRYLSRPNPIKIIINDNQIKPWDPFLTKEDATQELPQEQFTDGNQVVTIQPYVLPHHSRITSDTYELAEGPNGWIDQQGFYVYRNQRLLVAGSWFGLFKKAEPYKLARVMVDITSGSDFNWNIDVKKAFARPPEGLLSELKRIGSLAREASHRVYYHRGVKLTTGSSSQETSYVWEQVQKHGDVFFKINRKHPLLTSLLEQGKVDKKLLESFLSLIENTLPNNLVTLKPTAKDASEKEIDEHRKDDARDLLKLMVSALLGSGKSARDVLRIVSTMNPFDKYPDLIEDLKEELNNG